VVSAVKSQMEVYRAKAKEYARLTILTKSLRESRRSRKLADMYWALALGEKPEHDRPSSSAREGSAQDAVVGSRSVKRGQRRSGQPERRDILARMPWLMELGQWLRAEYNATDQRIPERLAALLEELKGRGP